MAQAEAASDWYVQVKVHNETGWDITLDQRMLAAAGTIETEPDSTVSANSTGNGGKYDAPFGPYGVSVLIAWNAPNSGYLFALAFVMPYIGSNSAEVKIVDSSTSVTQSLFDSMDGSGITSTSQGMSVDGTNYTFTVRKQNQKGETFIITVFADFLLYRRWYYAHLRFLYQV